MASLLASSSGSQVSSIQEKGSRNKRKFRADPPSVEPNKVAPSTQTECLNYEFSADKFETAMGYGQAIACELCSVNQDHADGLKLDLGLASALGPSEVGPSHKDELESDDFHDADWSDITETHLEKLVLSNLDAIFRTAIEKIVAYGYTEEVATKAVLRNGVCYGCKDTVSNIVDNTLAFLRNGQEIDPSREHYFENLQQLEKYILAELVCVLREVRPFFSTGDAMWCLLICDMNLSHACAMDSDPLSSFTTNDTPSECSSVPSQPQIKTIKGPELTLPNPCKSIPLSSSAHQCQSEAIAMSAVPNFTGSKDWEKEGSTTSVPSDNSSSTTAGVSASSALEEKIVVNRKVHSGNTRKDNVLRQKSFHLEKSYRTYGSKGSSRCTKLSGLSGLILDKKLKSADSAVNMKNASLKISKAMGIDMNHDHNNLNFASNAGPSTPVSFDLDTVGTGPNSPKSSLASSFSAVNASHALPALSSPPTLSTADTELSLSLLSKSNSSLHINCNPEICNSTCDGKPYDKSQGQWIPRDKKDAMILKLVPRVWELQNQLQEWTEWANQKVMQAARRLSKDKGELKTLRQEKEEVERLKKEKKMLEENTMKKLSEMELALCKASGQVERANATVCRLDVENAALRREMEAAKLHAAESEANCQEMSKKEVFTQIQFQSWEKQQFYFHEELLAEKRKFAQLLQELDQAKLLYDVIEARWEQEKKAKDELLLQASAIRKEKEQLEASAKSKEDIIKSKAEKNLQRYKEDIQKLEKEISQLRLKTDSSKIAALRRGIDGNLGGRFVDNKSGSTKKGSHASLISEVVAGYHDYSGTGGVKRDRECVMCLSEEMSIVFLPCAHQIVCTVCNELHEKQGMKDCPSCRSPIQQRIPVRYTRSRT